MNLAQKSDGFQKSETSEGKNAQVSLQLPPEWAPGFACPGTGLTSLSPQSPLLQELNQSRHSRTPFLGHSPSSTAGRMGDSHLLGVTRLLKKSRFCH